MKKQKVRVRKRVRKTTKVKNSSKKAIGVKLFKNKKFLTIAASIAMFTVLIVVAMQKDSTNNQSQSADSTTTATQSTSITDQTPQAAQDQPKTDQNTTTPISKPSNTQTPPPAQSNTTPTSTPSTPTAPSEERDTNGRTRMEFIVQLVKDWNELNTNSWDDQTTFIDKRYIINNSTYRHARFCPPIDNNNPFVTLCTDEQIKEMLYAGISDSENFIYKNGDSIPQYFSSKGSILFYLFNGDYLFGKLTDQLGTVKTTTQEGTIVLSDGVEYHGTVYTKYINGCYRSDIRKNSKGEWNTYLENIFESPFKADACTLEQHFIGSYKPTSEL